MNRLHIGVHTDLHHNNIQQNSNDIKQQQLDIISNIDKIKDKEKLILLANIINLITCIGLSGTNRNKEVSHTNESGQLLPTKQQFLACIRGMGFTKEQADIIYASAIHDENLSKVKKFFTIKTPGTIRTEFAEALNKEIKSKLTAEEKEAFF